MFLKFVIDGWCNGVKDKDSPPVFQDRDTLGYYIVNSFILVCDGKIPFMRTRSKLFGGSFICVAS